jgi:3-hydroxyisobutyrate dehydrogenase
MGRNMAAHILRGGYPLFVFNRTKSRSEELLKSGATWCESPREVAGQSDMVFTMVGYPHDVEETILGESGVLSAIRSEGVIVDMTTSSPALAQKIEAKARQHNVTALDAPVSGGEKGAKDAALSIMIGGDKTTAKLLDPIWNLIGKNIVYHGSAGAGQYAKIANQIMIAGNMIGVCEALLFTYKSGLDPVNVFNSVSTGAAGSWSLSNLAPKIMAGDFEPGFLVEHFVKDLGIALEESRRLGLVLPGLALAEQFYNKAKTDGHEKSGSQILIKILAELNNFDLSKKICEV